MLRPQQGPVLRHRSLRQELQLTLGCRRWKRELWGFHTHRRRLELRLRRCRQELRTSRWSGLGSAGTLAGGSSSVPGGEVGSVNNNGNNNNNWGEVGCVRQTISSHCDGYRQLRCLLDLRQDEPISQNPPISRVTQPANLSQPPLSLSGEKEGWARGKSFIKPLEGLCASCHLPEGLVSWLGLPPWYGMVWHGGRPNNQSGS